ncbi:MAG TPA: hypothetical protein VHE61_09580 [Opitutaceae bacterium]|nr:hypothetical protein [Opitutaceae bacterium]
MKSTSHAAIRRPAVHEQNSENQAFGMNKIASAAPGISVPLPLK